MTEIEVGRTAEGQLLFGFQVRLSDDDGSSTEHDVTLSVADHDRLGSGYKTPEAFIRACFEFLLEREAKGSILASFDVSQISTYFPEFEQLMLRPKNEPPGA